MPFSLSPLRYYLWGYADGKFGIVENANCAICVTPQVIPDQRCINGIVWNIPNMPFSLSQYAQYYQWGRAEFKIGIGDNAHFEICATSLVIPSRDSIFGIGRQCQICHFHSVLFGITCGVTQIAHLVFSTMPIPSNIDLTRVVFTELSVWKYHFETNMIQDS